MKNYSESFQTELSSQVQFPRYFNADMWQFYAELHGNSISRCHIIAFVNSTANNKF